jgi:hypothetical protein
MKAFYFLVALLALSSSVAFAHDPNPLQDFCVAINDTKGDIYILKQTLHLFKFIEIMILY